MSNAPISTQRCKACGMAHRRRRTYVRSKVRWTALEKRILVLLYPHLEMGELSALLGRSPMAIDLKSAREGLLPRGAAQ